MGLGEAAHVHEDGIGFADQADHRRLPGVVEAEEHVDAETAVGVRTNIQLTDALLDVVGRAREIAVQLAAGVIQELRDAGVTGGDIGGGNQLDAAQVTPARADQIDETASARAAAEDAKDRKAVADRAGYTAVE